MAMLVNFVLRVNDLPALTESDTTAEASPWRSRLGDLADALQDLFQQLEAQNALSL
jgi:hypothetical protein